MMAVKSMVVLAAALVSLASTVSATGGDDAVFALGASGSSLGVGGAHAAYCDNTTAVGLNPAALAWLSDVGITSLYVSQFGGVSYGAVEVCGPYVGIAASLVDSGWIPSGDTGFHYASQTLSGAVALPIGPAAVGIRCRFLWVGAPYEGHGWGLDGALLVQVGSVRVGAVVDSLVSSPMRYGAGTGNPWERDLAVGVAVTLKPFDNVETTLAADLESILSGVWRLVGGLEAWVGPLAGRVGWDGDGPTFGLSVRVSGVEVDWAYAARSDLGTSHRVSVEVLF